MINLRKYIIEKKKTHLIFDLDETILTLILPWEEWEKRIEEKLNKIDPSILKDYKEGKLSLNQMQNLYAKKGYKKLLDNHNHNWEKDLLRGIVNNEKVVDFIRKARRSYKFYIWTSNSQNIARQALEKVDILNHFDKIVSCETVDQLKPEEEGFYKIWDKKTPKKKYLFIGDSKNDETAAKKAGLDFINIRTYEI